MRTPHGGRLRVEVFHVLSPVRLREFDQRRPLSRLLHSAQASFPSGNMQLTKRCGRIGTDFRSQPRLKDPALSSSKNDWRAAARPLHKFT